MQYLRMEPESILDDHYDKWHRGRIMAEKGEVLKWLHLRCHEVHGKKMPYDERYTQYIKKTGLLPFVHLVSRSTPHMNPCAITALVDRWRPETHSFHLPCGEMTVTLQDVSMILALPIKGEPVCRSTSSDGWREAMRDLIGNAPTTEKMSAGAPYSWIQRNFKKCPEGAEDEVVEMYARAYLWYVVSRVLFSDGTGSNASFMWLQLFAGWEHNLSWGTAALAYLYRQLDDACCKTGKGASIGGCMLLLSIWSWLRLPVGRPIEMRRNDWNDHRDPLRFPTAAYIWDNTEPFHGESKECYMRYISQLDALTPEKVTWEPYGEPGSIARHILFRVNPKCLEEAHLWRMTCPLICFYAVEYHLPDRVMRQFGLFQETPPPWKDTRIELHELDKIRQKKEKNWPIRHRHYINKFKAIIRRIEDPKTVPVPLQPFDSEAFNRYLFWLGSVSRLYIKPPAFAPVDVGDGTYPDDEDMAKLDYNRRTREGRNPDPTRELRFVREEVSRVLSDAELALQSGTESTLRVFAERTKNWARGLCPNFLMHRLLVNG